MPEKCTAPLLRLSKKPKNHQQRTDNRTFENHCHIRISSVGDSLSLQELLVTGGCLGRTASPLGGAQRALNDWRLIRNTSGQYSPFCTCGARCGPRTSRGPMARPVVFRKDPRISSSFETVFAGFPGSSLKRCPLFPTCSDKSENEKRDGKCRPF